MPSRREFLHGCGAASAGIAALPAARASRTGPTPTADLDAALAGFGAGEVRGRLDPGVLPETAAALDTVRRHEADLGRVAAERVPRGTLADTLDATGSVGSADDLGSLTEADAFVGTTLGPEGLPAAHPAADAARGIESVGVAVDLTDRGAVVRARVVGHDGTPAVAQARELLSALGLPMAALDPFAVARDGGVTFTAGFADRDEEQPFVLALFLVLLAAVVGTFVLGLGDDVEQTTPQVSFSFDFDADSETLIITHDGGDSVRARQLRIVDDDTGADSLDRRWGSSGEVTAGDRVTVTAQADDRVRIIWESPEGDRSATLGLFQGPEA